MGVWASIKYALNSSLGTKDFKPLDRMILGMRSLQASSEVYMSIMPLKTNYVSVNSSAVFKGEQSITPYAAGSLALKITYKPGGSGFGGSSNVFKVLVNGVVVSTINLETGKTSETLYKITGAINYNAGDVITFESEVSSGGNQGLDFVCTKIEVLGTLTEYTALDIVKIESEV